MNDYFPLPPIHLQLAADTVTEILRAEIQKTGLKKAVIGLSGGIDSALSMVIAARALGPENVTAVMMPYKLSSPNSLAHAKLIAEKFGVEAIEEEITAMADPYFEAHPDIDKVRMGNVLARLRMIVLYDYSAKLGGLVVGTSNKTEILLGYSTLWGDMASAVNPIGDLFKTQVFSLSAFLDVPSEILNKPPSADLWEGQSDEKELQITYDLADRILYHWVDLCWSKERIKDYLKQHKSDIAPDKIDYLLKRVSRTQFKRKMPIIAKVSSYTIGREFRYPRDWNL